MTISMQSPGRERLARPWRAQARTPGRPVCPVSQWQCQWHLFRANESVSSVLRIGPVLLLPHTGRYRDGCAPMSTLVGQTVGNYLVRSLLGSGAMGEVYLGEHPRIQSKVAIKVLISELCANQGMASRFISEARAVNRVNQHNIIRVFDFGTLPDGRLYYVMEFLEGQELTEKLANDAPLSLDQTGVILAQVCAALDAAHQADIVHRDLKPDNIILVESGSGLLVKVLDFGIAKLLNTGLGAEHRTSTGLIMGTPLYMSPEQAAGQTDRITPRSDIYSLGVILYQMLSGRLPITAPTTAQLLARHIAEPPVPLRTVAPNLPSDIHSLVDSCLAKEPHERPPSAGEVYHRFARAQERCGEPRAAGVPVSTRSPPHSFTTERVSVTPTTLGDSAGESLDLRRLGITSGRRRMLYLILGGGPVCVIAALVALHTISHGSSGGKGKPDLDSSSEAPRPGAGGTRMQERSPPARRRPRRTATLEPGSRPAAATGAATATSLKPRLAVEATPRPVRVTVTLGTGRRIVRWAPLSLSIRRGARVAVRAAKRGYRPDTRRLVLRGDTTLRFHLTRIPSRGKASPPRATGRSRASAHAPRRPPFSAARSRPHSKPRSAGTRARPRPKIGESTLKPMF